MTLSDASCFTIGLNTRGRIRTRKRSSRPLSLLSWGFLCLDFRAFASGDIGFIVRPQPKDCDIIFTKTGPSVLDAPTAGLFTRPGVPITGGHVPLFVNGPTARVVPPSIPDIYNEKSVQLAGTHVVNPVGGKNILLSEPEEPTLTVSGTRNPNLFDICDC